MKNNNNNNCSTSILIHSFLSFDLERFKKETDWDQEKKDLINQISTKLKTIEDDALSQQNQKSSICLKEEGEIIAHCNASNKEISDSFSGMSCLLDDIKQHKIINGLSINSSLNPKDESIQGFNKLVENSKLSIKYLNKIIIKYQEKKLKIKILKKYSIFLY